MPRPVRVIRFNHRAKRVPKARPANAAVMNNNLLSNKKSAELSGAILPAGLPADL